MVISGTQRGSDEQIFINTFLVWNEYSADVTFDDSPYNLKGQVVHKEMTPILGSTVPINMQYGVGGGTHAGSQVRHAVGILASDLIVDSKTGSKTHNTQTGLQNIWAVTQIYGHCERIWTNGAVTAADLYLISSTSTSGCVEGATAEEIGAAGSGCNRIGLSGVVNITVTGGAETVTVDLSGANGTGSTWELGGGIFRKPYVDRDNTFIANASPITTDSSYNRPDPTTRVIALHYAEDDIVTTTPGGGDNGTQVQTLEPNSVTRGFIIAMGLGVPLSV